MREVKAYIREHMLDEVINALAVVPNLPGIAVVSVREFGHAVGKGKLVRTDMAKLEIDLPEELVEPVVQAILRHAKTGEGHPGDGKIFISELSEAVRIADGQRGAIAVQR